MKNLALKTAVFLCGAAVMAMELAGSRVMAPYIGTSLYVWTALIGVILAFLSAGYWLGGRWADREPQPGRLSAIVLCSALWLALLGLVYDPVLSLLQVALREPRLIALTGATLLFALPSLLLGMVLPYAARLELTAVQETGRTIGSLYALSTLGSIAGTFLAGFVLLAYLRNSVIFFLLACTLLLSSLLVSRARMGVKLVAILAAGAVIGAGDALTAKVYGGDLIDVNTAYNRIWVYDVDRTDRDLQVMQINDEISSWRYRDEKDLSTRYLRFFRLADHFVPGLRRTLMLGGAGYSFPVSFLKTDPEATIEVVEIDPGVTALARKYFDLPENPRLVVHHEDARTFLARDNGAYDAIYGDVFKSYSIPAHLATVEMMRSIHRALSPEGVYLANVIGSIEGDDGRFVRAEIATLKEVFPQVFVFATQDPKDGLEVQNLVLVALKSGKTPALESPRPDLAYFLKYLWRKPLPALEPPLTDDFAPVERYQAALFHSVQRPENPILARWKAWWGKKKG